MSLIPFFTPFRCLRLKREGNSQVRLARESDTFSAWRFRPGHQAPVTSIRHYLSIINMCKPRGAKHFFLQVSRCAVQFRLIGPGQSSS
jgi:hypothetical protein